MDNYPITITAGQAAPYLGLVNMEEEYNMFYLNQFKN